MLLLTADCIPIALARADGRPARGRDPPCRLARPARGHRRQPASARSARAASPPRSARASARAATRWGGGRDAVPRGFRRRRRRATASSTSGRRPSERSRGGRASRSTGSTCARVRCRPLLLAPPRPREDRTPGCHRLRRLSESRERYERIRGEVGPDVTVVVATKYVSLDDMAAAGRGRGRRRRREPRTGSRGEARALRRRVPLALHRAPAEPQGEDGRTRSASSCHSLDSESAAAKLTIPALVEVNLSRRGDEVRRRARRSCRRSSTLTPTCAA